MEQEKGNEPGSSFGNESPPAKTAGSAAGQKQELRDDLVTFPVSEAQPRQKFRGQESSSTKISRKEQQKTHPAVTLSRKLLKTQVLECPSLKMPWKSCKVLVLAEQKVGLSPSGS